MIAYIPEQNLDLRNSKLCTTVDLKSKAVYKKILLQ